jgi:uncharacterized phage infection (PIP) family protein YhgE
VAASDNDVVTGVADATGAAVAGNNVQVKADVVNEVSGRPRQGNASLHAVVKEVKQDIAQRLNELRQRRTETRLDINQAKVAFDKARLQMLQTRDKVIECRGNVSTDCEQSRNDAKLQSQETLLTAADEILSVLTALRDKIQASTTLSDADKTAAIADLDKRIAEIQAARDKVVALTDESDNKAILDAAKDIRQAWRDARPSVHAKASMLAYGELKAVTDAVERLSARIDDQIARFKAKGVDVSTVTSLKASFDGAVADAITHLDKAKQAYLGLTAGNVDAKVKTVRDEINAARDALKSAHDTLKQIVQELRTLAQQAKPTNETAAKGNESAS